MKKNGLVNLPNALTLLRLLLVPVFAAVYFLLPERRWIALVIYLSAALTDLLDGYLARRLNQITWFGKLFDPAADKLMCVMMLYCLAATGRIPWWVLVVVFLKEAYMGLGAFLMYSRSFVVKSDIFGKVSTFMFVLATALVFPWHGSARLTSIGRMLIIGAAAFSVAAAAHYTWMALRHANDAYKR